MRAEKTCNFRVLYALALGLVWLVAMSAGPSRAQTDGALAQALDIGMGGDWAGAAARVAGEGPITRDIIAWHMLRAGQGAFDQYRGFLERRSDWPGLPFLRTQGERTIAETARADQIVAYFSGQLPRTGFGSLRLAAALQEIGAAAIATSEIRRAWLTLALDPEEQALFLAQHGPEIADLHRQRLANLIGKRHFLSAAAMQPLVDAESWALAQARIALLQGKEGVDDLIAALPKSMLDDPGLAHARFEWRMAKGFFESAADLLTAQAGTETGLGDAEPWATGRLRLARFAAQEGRWQDSYDLAAGHELDSGSDYAAAEWQAGFAALIGLKDPALALGHFRKFRVAVFTPISLGRAGYWEGRALDALGRPGEARQAYEFAAEYQTSYYGQLAAIYLNAPMDPALAGQETYPDLAGTPLAQSSVFKAALLLDDAGQPLLLRRFLRHLAEAATPQEQGALGQLALSRDAPYAALSIAKYAAEKGNVLPRPYFPLPDGLTGPYPVADALMLAVARRESEFNPKAQSGVGARGLMQLMPGTAELMGKALNVDVEISDLTEQPQLNLRLGAGYLARLDQELNGYLPAIIAGYNAGPRNAEKWLEANNGPPRTLAEAVTWIELIPFAETRNYMMRVLESHQVYRARLAGGPVPWTLDKVLTGQSGA